MESGILENAELVLKHFQKLTDFEFGYDSQSVKWVDGYLNRLRANDDLDEDLQKSLVNTIGSYLGQCIIESFGGEWARSDGLLGIKFGDNNWAFPFSKVEKHLTNGSEDSIYSFFTCIPIVFNSPSIKK